MESFIIGGHYHVIIIHSTPSVTEKNGFLWDESQGGRGSSEIGSCLLMYISRLTDPTSAIILTVVKDKIETINFCFSPQLNYTL